MEGQYAWMQDEDGLVYYHKGKRLNMSKEEMETFHSIGNFHEAMDYLQQIYERDEYVRKQTEFKEE